jgi:hypothetical protein
MLTGMLPSCSLPIMVVSRRRPRGRIMYHEAHVQPGHLLGFVRMST